MWRVFGRGPQADVAQFHTDENPEPATLPFGRHGTDLQTDWRRLKPSGSSRQHGPGMGGDVPPLWRASHRSPATAKTGPPRAGTPGGGPRSRRRKPRAPGPRPRISTHIPHRVRPRPRPVARVPRRELSGHAGDGHWGGEDIVHGPCSDLSTLAESELSLGI